MCVYICVCVYYIYMYICVYVYIYNGVGSEKRRGGDGMRNSDSVSQSIVSNFSPSSVQVRPLCAPFRRCGLLTL